jgi:hypothetical protein
MVGGSRAGRAAQQVVSTYVDGEAGGREAAGRGLGEQGRRDGRLPQAPRSRNHRLVLPFAGALSSPDGRTWGACGGAWWNGDCRRGGAASEHVWGGPDPGPISAGLLARSRLGRFVIGHKKICGYLLIVKKFQLPY